MGDYAWQKVEYSYPQHFAKDISRNFKGFNFEINTCKEELDSIPYLTYNCNPTDFSDWLHNHNKNSFDAAVTYSNGTTERLEMKYVSDGISIASSWFKRDWLDRDAKIIITNNPTAVKYRDKRIAERMGKKILSVSEAKVYLSKKAYQIAHPNQLSSWNSLIQSIVSEYQVISSKIISKVAPPKAKSRLKRNLLKLKFSMMARLPKYNPASAFRR